jgi:hypothetical protein
MHARTAARIRQGNGAVSSDADRVERALTALAQESTIDVVYLEPLDQPAHFDPFSAVVAICGVIVLSYLRGFTERAKDRAREAGAATFDRVAERIASVFRGDLTTPTAEVADAAAKAWTAIADLGAAERQNVAQASEDALTRELEAQGLPERKARAFAVRARATALELAANETS